MSKVRLAKQCYICGAEGRTREHVPPLSFFPEGFRRNLWTVGSCNDHNFGNSKDVEYVRNVVVNHRSCKGIAQALAQPAAFRSFKRSAALFAQTFHRARPMVIDGQLTAVIPLDLPRFDRVMKAIACGIYFRDNLEPYKGDWAVFSPMLLMTEDIQGIPNNWDNLRKLMHAAPFTLKDTPEPTIFRYGERGSGDGLHLSYAFEFYGGFHVYVGGASATDIGWQ